MTAQIEEKKIELPFTLKEKLQALKNALDATDPSFPLFLAQILDITQKTPEFVYGLSDEEIRVIVSGMSKHSGIVIQAAKEKKEKKGEAALLKDLSADSV